MPRMTGAAAPVRVLGLAASHQAWREFVFIMKAKLLLFLNTYNKCMMIFR